MNNIWFGKKSLPITGSISLMKLLCYLNSNFQETGTPVGVAARMQINMHVKPYPGNKLGVGRVK